MTYYIAQIDAQGRMMIWEDNHIATEVTTLEQLKTLIGGHPLVLSSTLEFATWHTKDAAVIALARALRAGSHTAWDIKFPTPKEK
jgi:hypothetical protein